MASSNFPKLPGYAPTHDPTIVQNKKISHVHLDKIKNSKDQPVPLYSVPNPAKNLQYKPKNTASMSYSHNQFPNHFAAAGEDEQTQFEPTFVKLDKQVLRFFGYFKEHVVESALENHRIRKVVICYYLEDSSIEIKEPKQSNSGTPQGQFLKRQVVNRHDGIPFSPNDFGIGADTSIHARIIRIFDCDGFTRAYFQQQGINCPPGQPVPHDNFVESQIPKPLKKDPEMREYKEKSLGGGKIQSQKQFLDKDRQVLRFFTQAEGQSFIIDYYLADDTIEIRECHHPNDGRDCFAVKLRRQKLPDNFAVNQPGQNQIGDNYLTCDEITPESNINAYGCEYIITGVNPFTQRFYQENYGYYFPVGNVQMPAIPEAVARLVPPYNGFGDYEDSLGQQDRLLPKPKKVNFFKIMDNSAKVLRFTSCFNTRVHEDKDRRFIISFYLADDSISVYEPEQKNSGILKGKFLHRNRYKNVDKNDEFLTLSDLQIGGNVKINGHSFHVLSADQYTEAYMNTHLD